MTISGRTKLIAHLGYPTESFKAPMIYNPYFEKHNIDAVVVPMGCSAEDYGAFLKLVFRLSNIHGALVTMPHKVTTVPLLDEVMTTANGVKLVGHANVPSRIAVDASQLYAKNLLNFLALIIDKDKALKIDAADEIIKGTLLTMDGAVVHSALAPKTPA